MVSSGVREESVQRAKAVFSTIKGWLVTQNAVGPHSGPGIEEKVRATHLLFSNFCRRGAWQIALAVASRISFVFVLILDCWLCADMVA